MIGAVLITFALLLSAVAAAMAVEWRRWTSAPVQAEAKTQGPARYPRVKR